MGIVRQEMDKIGQEFYLPAIHPRELWEASGRWAIMGENLFRLKDRKGADMCLGMTEEEALHKFGFLLGAFEYGAPPHGGIAFGFDRLCAILGGSESIRDFIAFPKNNSGRDVMLDAPSTIDDKQFDELQIKLDLKG